MYICDGDRDKNCAANTVTKWVTSAAAAAGGDPIKSKKNLIGQSKKQTNKKLSSEFIYINCIWGKVVVIVVDY